MVDATYQQPNEVEEQEATLEDHYQSKILPYKRIKTDIITTTELGSHSQLPYPLLPAKQGLA
jgi:hypothetical protein